MGLAQRLPDLIIFDCDGVLVDSEGLSNRTLAECISEVGWAITAQESMQRFIGRRMDDVMATVAARIGRPLPQGWLEDYERRRDNVFRAELQPVAGVSDLLTTLVSRDVKFCVASSGPLTKMNLTLGLTGLAKYFTPDRLFSARGLPRGKPSPDVFLHAAQRLGAAPNCCVVIEDSPAGVAAACAAGMYCLGYAPRGEDAALSAMGAACFAAMDSLPGLLGLAVGRGDQS